MGDSLFYTIALTLTQGVGDVTTKKLIKHYGSAQAVFEEKKTLLQKVSGISMPQANAIASQESFKRAEEELAFINKEGISPLYFEDKNYPLNLKHCYDAPVLLYSKGQTEYKSPKFISIVGTRNATTYGLEVCNQIVKDLVPHNPIIVSGLAYGIDICAHKAALKNNLPTIGVLAHGLDKIYPAVHTDVAKQMQETGALFTEHISGSRPDRENFPKRNRIVAGMADAVIVVEGTEKGGALITAEIANSYNREVFAVPGRLKDPFSAGCNKLIRTNKAALYNSVADLEYILGWEKNQAPVNKALQIELFSNLSPDENQLAEVLKTKEKIEIDELALVAALPVHKVNQLLISMELKGLVKAMPGKMYALA